MDHTTSTVEIGKLGAVVEARYPLDCLDFCEAEGKVSGTPMCDHNGVSARQESTMESMVEGFCTVAFRITVFHTLVCTCTILGKEAGTPMHVSAAPNVECRTCGTWLEGRIANSIGKRKCM